MPGGVHDWPRAGGHGGPAGLTKLLAKDTSNKHPQCIPDKVWAFRPLPFGRGSASLIDPGTILVLIKNVFVLDCDIPGYINALVLQSQTTTS